jgi:2-polyprenyl-3-methyl-5-hydroxy-6-metoxy-1,4-benzoquinol methylase
MTIIKNDSDQDWQAWGKNNAYFGVLADPKFLDANLNEESLREFFDSGERHVEHVYRVIRATLQSDFQPDTILDYGCGVGRLVIPFARRSGTVVGVDVSRAMLDKAQMNCDKYQATSARLVHVQELGSLTPGSFDLVHSFIVFQHIPFARGEVIFRKLISLLAEGGVGAVHFIYADSCSALRRGIRGLRERVNLVHKLMNVVQGKPFSTPLMQMNSYSVDRIFDILANNGCSSLHVELTDHGGFHGAMLYFEKHSGSARL